MSAKDYVDMFAKMEPQLINLKFKDNKVVVRMDGVDERLFSDKNNLGLTLAACYWVTSGKVFNIVFEGHMTQEVHDELADMLKRIATSVTKSS